MTALRILALTILYFCCFAGVSGALLSTTSKPPAPDATATTLLALFVVSLLNTGVLTYIVLRSRWTGWKLILSLFFVFYGVTTVMSQVETAFFITNLPPGMLPRLFIAGMIVAAVFVPATVFILGKGRADETWQRTPLQMSAGVWIAKLSVIVIAYVVIYFTFGYFIAWKSAAVRAYYGGNDPGSLIAQVTSVFHEQPLLFLLQAGRALLWAAIAVPVIKMMKGEWWESGLAVALLFVVVMNSQLLLPNPLMPTEVRMVHLVEVATSNLLFAWLVVLTLRWPLRQAN